MSYREAFSRSALASSVRPSASRRDAGAVFGLGVLLAMRLLLGGKRVQARHRTIDGHRPVS